MYEELFRDGDIRKDTGHSDIFAAIAGEADSSLSEEQMQGLKHLSGTERSGYSRSNNSGIVASYSAGFDSPTHIRGQATLTKKGSLRGVCKKFCVNGAFFIILVSKINHILYIIRNGLKA